MDSLEEELEGLISYLRRDRGLNRWHERLLLITLLADHAINDKLVFEELRREVAKIEKENDPSVA